MLFGVSELDRMQKQKGSGYLQKQKQKTGHQIFQKCTCRYLII